LVLGKNGQKWRPIMDLLYFLKDRTAFLRDFYKVASAPFVDIKRKIECGEAPFEPHLAKYEDEPPFTTEWIEAKTRRSIPRCPTQNRRL
jgi:hypothetical protein